MIVEGTIIGYGYMPGRRDRGYVALKTNTGVKVVRTIYPERVIHLRLEDELRLQVYESKLSGRLRHYAAS